ncbi:MAG: hypothetical protein ACLQUT_09410 [Thermoleophilia bacterium]
MTSRPTNEMKSGYIRGDSSIDTIAGAGNLDHVKRSPLTAIKYHCLNCMGGSLHSWQMADGSVSGPQLPWEEVKACPAMTCELWPFRQGRNPYTRNRGNPDTLRKLRRASSATASNGENRPAHSDEALLTSTTLRGQFSAPLAASNTSPERSLP